MRWRVIVKKEPLIGLDFSSLADPKHPRRILHLLSAHQGQTLDELHLLRKKKTINIAFTRDF